MKIDSKQIADNIRAERNRVRMTQEEVANALGVRRETYNGYETDAKNLRVTMLVKLAELFDCSIGSFYVQSSFTNSEDNE